MSLFQRFHCINIAKAGIHWRLQYFCSGLATKFVRTTLVLSVKYVSTVIDSSAKFTHGLVFAKPRSQAPPSDGKLGGA